MQLENYLTSFNNEDNCLQRIKVNNSKDAKMLVRLAEDLMKQAN